MFHHLVLACSFPNWTVGTTNIPTAATGTGGLDGYFFTGTPYGLVMPGSPGTIETVQILSQDNRYTYQSGIWWASPPISHSNIVGVFAALPPPTGFTNPTPAIFCGNMISYMANYSAYAASGFSNATLQGNLRTSQQTLSNNAYTLSQ
jgi:hypothetical protein